MLIHKKMSEMTSSKMKAEWINILKRYKGIVGNTVKNIEENIIDIQAKRLVKAEAAALGYGSR